MTVQHRFLLISSAHVNITACELVQHTIEGCESLVKEREAARKRRTYSYSTVIYTPYYNLTFPQYNGGGFPPLLWAILASLLTASCVEQVHTVRLL